MANGNEISSLNPRIRAQPARKRQKSATERCCKHDAPHVCVQNRSRLSLTSIAKEVTDLTIHVGKVDQAIFEKNTCIPMKFTSKT